MTDGSIHITMPESALPQGAQQSSAGELAVDVFEDEHRILIIAPIAGLNASEIEISVDGDLLTIKGKRTPPTDSEGMRVYASECFWGAFERTIALPDAVNSADTSASFKNSILSISIPKARKVAVKTIKIAA